MKKLVATTLILALAASIFTGCAKTQKTEDTTAAGTTAAASTTAAATEAKPITATVFHHMSEEGKRNGVKAIADEVTKANPNIKFDVQAIDFGQFAATLKTKIAAGDAPDIIMERPKSYPDLVEAGHIMDITGAPFLALMNENALPSLKINDKVYGVGLDVTAMGIFYNKDIFKDAGIEVPKTYTEFLNVLTKLKEKGITTIARGFKDSWTAQVAFQTFFHQMLKNNPNFFADITSGSKKFKDFSEFKDALEHYGKSLEYSQNDPFGTDYSKSIELFATGKSAMFINGIWALSEIRKISPNANIGFFAAPNYDDESKVTLTAFVDDGMMISAETKNKDAAFKFAEVSLSKAGAEAWVKSSNTISYAKDAQVEYSDPVVKDVLGYISAGKTVGQEDAATFGGQMDAEFRKFQEEFSATKDRNADTAIANLDKLFDSIR